MMLTNERGLTLAEILVAVAVIGLGLVGLAVVIPVSSYGVQEGSQLSTATFLAEQMIERARAAAWTSTPAPGSDCLGVSAGNAAPVPVAPATCNGSAVTQFPDEANVTGYTQYARTVRVTDCGATPCAGTTDATMRLVTVTVTYAPISVRGGQSGSTKTVQLEWLVSRK